MYLSEIDKMGNITGSLQPQAAETRRFARGSQFDISGFTKFLDDTLSISAIHSLPIDIDISAAHSVHQRAYANCEKSMYVPARN